MSFAEWSNNKKKKKQEQQEKEQNNASTSRTSFGEWSNKKLVNSVDEDYISSFISDANKFFGSAENDYNAIEWGNASISFDTKRSTWNDLDVRASRINTWLEQNKDRIDTKTYKSLYDTLSSFQKDSWSIVKSFEQARDYYSQFKSEDEYNQYLKGVEEYEKKKNYDLGAGQKELDYLKSLQEEAEKISINASSRASVSTPEGGWLPTYNYGYDDGFDRGTFGGQSEIPGMSSSTNIVYTEEEKKRLKDIDEILKSKGYGGIDDLKGVISEQTAYYNQAKRLQDGLVLASAVDNPDFDTYSKYQSTKSDGIWSKLTSQYGMGYDDLTYEYINNKDGIREEINQAYRGFNSDSISLDRESMLEANHYSLMTEDEVAIYNYYYAKEGKKKAEEYLESIQETLNMRAAEKTFSRLEDNTALEMVFGIAAGLDQFGSGIKNLFSTKDYIPPSSTQITSGMVREDLEDNGFKFLGSSLGQIGYDIITTTSNQLPSILIGAATGGLGGALTLGVSATGNAYAEMLNLGYDKGQARAYSTLVGAAETGLQYFLGGISKLGGKVSGNVISKALSKVDNAFGRVAIKLGGNMLSEGIEEGLQTVLEPWFESLVTGVDFDAPNIDEILYSGLLGALSAGMLEGVGAVSGEVNSYKQGKNIKESGAESVNRLKKLGSTFSADTVSYQLAGKVNENTGAYTIGRLLNEVGASLSEKNMSDIETALVTEGITSGDAKTISKWLNKAVDGGYFNKRQIQALENNEVISKVFNEVILGQNSTVNQRTGEYNELYTLAQKKAKGKAQEVKTKEASKSLDTNRINSKEYSRLIADLDDVQSDTSASEATVGETPTAENGEKITSEVENTPEIKSVENDVLKAFETVADNVKTEEESTVTLAEASTKYGAQANAMIHTYTEGQDVAEYDNAYSIAYNMGKSGVSLSYAMDSKGTSYLTEKQRELAYEAGKAAADTSAKEQDAKNKNAVNGKTGRKKGTVKGEGVTISDLKKTFNDTQNKAYKTLVTVAEVTGIDIVLYKSETDADGNFVGAQGKFVWSDDKLYIDINAGLKSQNSVDNLAKYAMLRSFSHEFTHFIEKWNPIYYNEFRKAVFDELTARGEDVDALIIKKQNLDSGNPLSYEKASREVVAEAMTDILPDSHFVETLATKHKNVFEKLLDMLKEFLADIKEYFNTIVNNPSIEANALKEEVGEAVHYVENIVKMFDKVAVEAVENYQMAIAIDEVAEKPAEKSADSEFDPKGNPIYETKENRRPVEPVNFKLLANIRNQSDEKYGLSEEQSAALRAYVMSAKLINEKMNSGNISEKDSLRINKLVEALNKFPTFEGKTYRNLKFDNEQSYNSFLEKQVVNSIIPLDAFTSASKRPNGYPLFGKYVVHMVLDGVAGRDIADTYGLPRQQEVVFLPGTKYKVNSVSTANDGHPIIFVKEIANNEVQDNDGDLGGRKLRPFGSGKSNVAVPQGEGNVDGGVYGNGGRTENNGGVSRSKIRNSNIKRNGESQEERTEVKASEGTSDNSDVYESLRTPLSHLPRFETGGFLFRVYKNGDTYQGHIDKVNQTEGGYPVSDASGLHYKSEIYNNRADAVDDIIAVARNNKLLEAKADNIEPAKVTTEKPLETTPKAETPKQETESKVEKTYESTLDKKTISHFSRALRSYIAEIEGQKFITDGSLVIHVPDADIPYAKKEFDAKETKLPQQTLEAFSKATTLITEAPMETTLENSIYVFNVDGKNMYFNKKLFSHIDGGLLYYGQYADGYVIKSVNEDGTVKGYLLSMRIPNADSIKDFKPSKLKSFSKKMQSLINGTANNKQEVKPNVENVDNRGTVQQPDTNRQGDPQVLEGLQTQDVRGDVQGGDTVGDSVKGGQEVGRDGTSTDNGAGARSRSGVGDSQIGDIRGDDELSPKATKELHEKVEVQISQQSTEKPKGRNFVIGDTLDLPNGEKARYKANIEAIRLIKTLEAEGRYATEQEQAILSKYVGWGGLANAFDERKADWSKEFKELKELLTKEEYELARGSTLNAHYTEISVIKAMYEGLNKLGFNGGRMLEPSSGVGNFVGAMPADMSAKVKSWTMVELDGITGLIAKYLYPNADVRIQGFEKANIPNNFMDVIISNVPFGNYPITDKAYPKKVTSAIHNYFFAKSLDKVRPGGIVMFITSAYTMNSKDETVRRYIMQRADLLGAIRLPDTAFKGNAGTEVVTDILILKKRPANTPYAGEDFLEAPYKYVSGYNGAYINSYFNNHPEMVLGTATMDGSMYRGASLTYKALEGKGSLADQIREAFSHIKGKMEYPAQLSPEKTNFAVEKAGKKTKQDGYIAKNGKIYQNKDGELVEQTVTPKVAERIKGMLEIRDAAKALTNAQQQGLKDTEIKKARANLNKIYDAFVKKNGFINAPANRSAFNGDPDRYSVFALENWDNDKKTATKSDIFSKNTIAPNRTVNSAKNVNEGLIVSVNQTGGVDVSLIARLTGKTEADVTRELLDSRQAFKNRNGVLETAETYLSGNVRAKLRDAEALVPMDSDYQRNVEALKAVMPDDVSYQDIFVNPGTPWIPSSVYSDFAAYMLGGRNTEYRQDIDVTRNPDTGNFTVELKSFYLKHNASNTQKWGTPRRSFLDLFDAMLNSKSVVVKDKLDDGSFIINKDATAAANEKIENITKEFQEWLWKDEARRTELATLYNEVFNSIVTPKYNGDNLTVNGANAMKPLRPHQRNAVQRVISSGGNTLLAHKVGAGKTYEMAAAAMKLKELGLVKKPLFAVPKSLVAQWGTEFIDFFPTAKLLVAEATDFSTANRKVFMNRIATGDYDAVIVSYEQFEKLPVSDDFTREFYQEQINSVIAAIEEAKAEKGAKALSVKDLEKKRKSLQAKIDKLTDKAKDEGNIDFEELGVDSLFIDEAHNFKNLFYTTSMTNVSGLGNKDGSKRAFDLYTKVRYLQKLNGGKGIVFATATPVMNSMSEMYIMQKYLQPDLLEQLGLNTFDAWAKQFGEVVNGVEIKPSGQGYRVKQSFSRFKNMSELQLLFRNFADVLTDIPGLKIPKMKGGAVNVVVCEPGQFQQNYMKELEKRADNIKNVDPSVDNMLKITSDGRKISYTQRMIDPTLPYEEGCKIYRCAENVVKAYNESKDIKGTQLIFCDMATPKGKNKAAETTETDDASMDMESAKLYDDIKARLIQEDIPAKEIAFIHEADTDQKKKKLFADVNDGKVRVLIGSTGKMGVGMNAQKRVVAIHHLDAPWRPGDVEQRNGRAFRQGNINEEVECFTYVTEGSFDARLWDILERKQNFINQVMNGESVGRETEDTGEVTLFAAEVKALASGSPLIMEQVQLDTDIKKLESLYRSHLSSVRAAKERLEKDRGSINLLERLIDLGKSDIQATKDTYSEGKFSITVGKQKFTEKKDAGVALMAEATAKANTTDYTSIGNFAGFDVRVIKTAEGIKGIISGKQGYPFNTYPNNTTFMINHMISVVEGISEKVKMWESSLVETRKDMAEQEKLINDPFSKQTELDEKRKRYTEVMEILNPKEEQSLDSVAEDTVQEQSREYLEEDEKSVVAQAITSAKTSIKQIPALFKHPDVEFGETNIDIGGGRFDLATNYLAERGTKNLVFDPYNRSEEVNRATLNLLLNGNKADTATCANVLNVIAEERARANVILEVAKAIKSNGTAYFMVYEGNGTGVGAETSSGYQNNRKTADYVQEIQQYFDNVQRKGKLITASFPKVNLPKASWEISPGNAIQYQQRSEGLTDYEVLESASNEIKVSDLTQAENDALTIFQDRLARLKDLQDKRAEQGRLYKEQQFGAKVNRAEAEKTLNRMHVLDDQIKKATADVLTVEEKEVLKRVLKKARKVVEVQERKHGHELLNRWRDRRNNAAAIKKYRDRLRGDVDELTTWITGPNNKDITKHVPDVLKNSVIPFLSSINFMSKRSLKGGDATVSDKAFIKNLEALKSALKINIDVYGMYSGYSDLPPNFMESLENFIKSAQALVEKSAGEFIINQMTSSELKELSQVVRTLKKYITQFNRFHNNAMYQHVYEAGDNSIGFLEKLDRAGEHTGGISNFVFWQQIRPAYAFERFGKGGEAIYDGLRRGQAKLAFNTKEIQEFTKKAYTSKEVKAWENEIKEFNLKRDIVKIPVSYIMGLYELSKDPEALVHIENGGIRVATYTHKGKKISDVGHVLTTAEFNQIIGSLTDRQKEVADSLQKYMADQGAKWGNYVSVARFGEELFTNPKYYPINSDGRHLSATVEEHPSAASLYALLNMSFTKSRKEGANNRVVVYSIFDVFANHMASMAQYNAMALPILDALKWFNYQQVLIDDEGNKVVLGNLREQLARVYGVPDETRPGSGKQGYAETFIVNIIKAFNGTAAQGTPYDTLGLKSMHRYNVAQVAYNLRVVVQQPLAITRAGMLINYSSIIRGMKLKPSAIKKNIEEMQKYSGIAAWKSLGFYDVNISRGLTHLIKHDSTVFDKIGDVGMWGAEKADTLTWAAIWSASKEQVMKKQHLTPESEGFYEAVSKLFEDVIYKTQVVDSILTKNEFMRDKGTFARLVGSFMSEPVTNASMLIDSIDKYHLDMKRGMSRREAWQKNGKMIGRRLYVYGVGAVLLAAVQAVADAFRDDDEYEEWYEKWLEAFGGNFIDELMPFNKLPIVADFYDLAKEIASILGADTYGNPPQSVFMQWYDSLVKGTEIIHDKITGEDTNYTWYGGIYKLLQAASGMAGLPMASATREVITVWNNTVGAMAPSLKVKTYEPSELSQIRYAYEDGYLTYDEVIELLLEQGLVDTENEAYFTVEGWKAGDGYLRYDKIYDAILKGESIEEAMAELTSHGYTEKAVLSQVKSQIGEWYQNGEISKSQATNMLTKYGDMDSDEITATVNKWSSYVVTGIKYDDIDDEFMEGNITYSRAIEMYVRYGGMTREKATEKVEVLKFVKENPETEGISYSAVNSYNTYCEPYGVPVKTYYDAWVYKNTLSGTVKEQMMYYINSLSLSSRQKDSLYYAFGWAESKLWEAPWH